MFTSFVFGSARRFSRWVGVVLITCPLLNHQLLQVTWDMFFFQVFEVTCLSKKKLATCFSKWSLFRGTFVRRNLKWRDLCFLKKIYLGMLGLYHLYVRFQTASRLEDAGRIVKLSQLPAKHDTHICRWWFQILSIFYPYLGKIPILASIFFRWGGSATNQIFFDTDWSLRTLRTCQDASLQIQWIFGSVEWLVEMFFFWDKMWA